MRSKILVLVLCVLFGTSLIFSYDAHARAGSSSGGKSSSSTKSSGSSRGGYGNSASKPDSGSTGSQSVRGSSYGNSATQPSPGASSGSSAPRYGNSATPPAASASADPVKSPARSPIQEKMNRNFSKQESAKAYEAYSAQQSKFQKGTGSSYKPGNSEQTTINSVRNQASYSSGSNWYSRRTVFYETNSWQPPVYVYRSYGSFGIWDAMMLWFMLDHISERQYAEMYYHHRDDPGMQQFRKEVDRLSAENAELKEKVKNLDESTMSLEQQGVKVNPAYVPSDAAGIALAADYVDKAASPKKSSGFPWGWVAVIGILGGLGYYFMRRKR